MRHLKLLFLTLISVISFNLFSQGMVITTNTSGQNVCDGSATLDTTNVTLSSIYWQTGVAIINQGSYSLFNLCPGTYSVTFNLNGSTVTQSFTIGTGGPCSSFSGYITTTNVSGPTLCDGTVDLILNGGTAPYTYMWDNGATTQGQIQLCTGAYCCTIVDAMGCMINVCDSVVGQSLIYGDTLTINGGSSCNNSLGTLTVSLEACGLDFNVVDSAYIVSISYPTNILDSTLCVWGIVDTTGAITCIPINYYAPNTGCYDIQLILYCYQKSMNYRTIIATQGMYMGVVDVTEIKPNKKELVKVVDFMGKETDIIKYKVLIFIYSDGTNEMKYIGE